MKTIPLFLLTISLAVISLAGSRPTAALTLNSLTQQEVQSVLKDLNLSMNSSITPSSSKLFWGLELGVAGSVVDSPNIRKYDPNIDRLANGGAYAQISLPYGIGLNGYKLSSHYHKNDLDYNYNSLGISWSFGSLVNLMTGLDMQIQYKKSKGDIRVTNRPTTGSVTYGNYNYKADTLSLYAIKSFGFVEPFIGISYMITDDGFNADASFFNNAVAQSYAANGIDQESTTASYGVNFYVFHFLRVGLEYSTGHFDRDRLSASLALSI